MHSCLATWIQIARDYLLLKIEVIDKGVGIENIEEARTPLFSTGSSKERAGLGFTIMDIFSDKLEIFSKVNEGTKVAITKYIA